MDDMIEPRRSSRPRRQHVLFKAFGKDAAAAKDGVAAKPARMDDDSNRPVADWQIRQTPAIPTMNPRGIGPASRIPGTGWFCQQGARQSPCRSTHYLRLQQRTHSAPNSTLGGRSAWQ